MTSITDFSNWYWFMNGDSTQVWSSAKVDFVPLTDADYIKWTQSHVAPKMSWPSLFNYMVQAKLSAALSIALAHRDLLTPDQVTFALLAGGLNLVSVSAPTLNGLYSVSPDSQLKISAIASGINAGHLPEGQAAIGILDMSGAVHNFTSRQFLALAAAMEDYVYKLHIAEAIALVGGSPIWPDTTAAIL